MPQVIPVAIAAGMAAAGEISWMAVGVMAAMTAANYIVSDMLKPNTSEDPVINSERGHLVNTKSTEQPLRLIYGPCRVGINLVYVGLSGADNKYLHIVGTIGEGEINGIAQDDGIDQLFLNDKIYTEYGSLVYYEVFTGTSDQNVCTTLQSAIPEWNDPMRYTAYIYLRLEFDRDIFQSIPAVTLEVEGLKVYNPDTETTEYSTNIAYCARDFITRSSRRGGMGISSTRLDDSSFIATQAYNNAKGWTIGLPIEENIAAADNLPKILCCGRNVLIYSGTEYKLKYKDLNYESAVMTLDEHDVVDTGESTLTVVQPTIFDTPNAVRIKFLNSELKYQTDDYVLSDLDAIEDDGGDYREEKIELPGINDRSNAIKMANYYLERLRINKTVGLQSGSKCMPLEANDIIQLTHEIPGWSNKYLRVEGIKIDQNADVALELIEETEDMYDDLYNLSSHSWHDTTLPDPSATIPSVINVSHSEEVYYYRGRSFTRWKIDFDPPSSSVYPFWKYANIYLKIGSGEWKYMTKVESDYQVDPVEEGETYYLRIQSVNIWEAKQNTNDAIVVSKTIVGKTSVPSNISAVTAVASGDAVSIFAPEITDPDISGYEIRLGDSWVGGILIGKQSAPFIRLTGVKPGTFTFFMSPVDNAGKYSSTPKSTSVTVYDPIGYEASGSWDTWAWDFSTGTHDNTEQDTYSGDTVLKCSHTDDVLIGIWTSPEYDLGSSKTVRCWGDFLTVFAASGNTWGGIIPSPNIWSSIDVDTSTWREIFATDRAGVLSATIYWGDSSGSLTNSADFFQILAPEFTARYIQVVITITDPTLDSQLYLKELNMKAAERA